MNAELARRGPDGEGIQVWGEGAVVLGHRRLSIFDLSEAGRQPMVSADGNTGLVFNGAIYNFHDLRAELESKGYRFRGNSDTEVILHGYDAWGIDALVAKMRGMFAIGLWDQRAGKLWLVRDRLGVKPLVYAVRGSEIVFASTVRALRAAGFGGDIDPIAIAEMFEYGFITDKRTIYQGVRKVPAATILEFCNGRETRRSSYWSESVARPSGAISFGEAVEETERLFVEAVRMRLEADVPVGALLSGGVDSSLVCWAIAKLGADIKAFTVGTPGDPWDETADAVATARKLGIAHEVVEMRGGDAADDLGELIDAYGEPFPNASALGMLRVSRAIKPSATVLLTGDGGDDCFLGYPAYHAFYQSQKAAPLVSWWWRPKGARRPDSMPGLLRRASHFLDYAAGGLGASTRISEGLPQFGDMLGERLRGVQLEERQIPMNAAAARRALADYIVYHREHRFTGEYMTKVDGATMRHGLEARSPFLDQDLWNFAQSLPYELRLRGGVLKAVLREIARRRIGEVVATGKKRGFGIPVGKWLAAEGPWRRQFEEMLEDSVAAREGWIDAGAVRRELERCGERAPNSLWYVFVLENWLRRRDW
jgi:asparagine synthase (glutamine-hydrolysing)